jgi:hypothetical protein
MDWIIVFWVKLIRKVFLSLHGINKEGGDLKWNKQYLFNKPMNIPHNNHKFCKKKDQSQKQTFP